MSPRPTAYQARVAIGARAAPVGQLQFVRDGRREYGAFTYGEAWLRSPERFEISPDLPLREGWVTRRALTGQDSPWSGHGCSRHRRFKPHVKQGVRRML